MAKASIALIAPVATFDTIGAFHAIASACASHEAALTAINNQIAALREAGVKFGKSKKTCMYRVQILDAFKAAFPGRAEKTFANYVTSIVAAVNDGAEFSFSGSKGEASKGKGSQKAGEKAEKSDAEKMIGALLNVWKLSDVAEDVLIQVEAAMADGTPLIDAIAEVLQAAGEELGE